MGRAPCCDKAKVKRGPWSPEEDATLRSHIQIHGTGGNWIALPHKIGLKRCGKSCRLRWLNYLRPNLRHGGYTEDEDNLICSLYLTIGSRWSIIAAQLPGRTDNDIKNYWNTRLKKKLLGKQTRRRITNKLACHNDDESNNLMSLYTAAPPPYTTGNSDPTLHSSVMPQMEANFSYHHLETDFHGMYNESMQQLFDGVNAVSVNSSAVNTSFSQIWGDAVNYYPTNYNYNEDLFDEARLLGYSQ